MAILLATASLTASGASTTRPTKKTGSGLITGRWVLAAKFPAPRGFGRGYRRKAVDGFLVECANGIDWLHGLLVGAEKEIDRLNRLLATANDEIAQLTASAPISREVAQPTSARQTGNRSLGRAAALKQRRRTERPVTGRRTKRPRIRTGSQRVGSPS
jgi:hypothetical protein